MVGGHTLASVLLLLVLVLALSLLWLVLWALGVRDDVRRIATAVRYGHGMDQKSCEWVADRLEEAVSRGRFA